MKTSLKQFSKPYASDVDDLSEFVHDVSVRGADVLSHKILAFCHLLRANGIEVTASRIIDTFRALKVINVFHRGDFYTLLEANMISRATDRELFQQLFLQFWRGPVWAGIPDPCLPAGEDGCDLPPPRPEALSLQMHQHDNGQEPDDEKLQHSISLYSPAEVLHHKDFGKMAEQELLRIQQLIMTMARQMATRLSRRKKVAAKATTLDAGRTMRQSLRYGGEVLELIYRGQKLGKTKLVVLCDVSGSMDVYTRFLVQFLYGLQNGLRGVETIVFSTRLTRITPLLRRRNVNAALDLIAASVHDWSGGTKIGACLKIFNDTMAAQMVNSKTLVIIISDGWDTGDTEMLDTEMAKLKARAFRLIWLNPLLGSPNYQPLCKGMHTALPYVDDFMPVHNVESLRQFGQLVGRLTA
jgi:uncharacterized protein with von Willebrand factor type A (vWA) domain